MIDWETAPHWANYAAMDANGTWHWYSNLPTPDGEYEWVERFGESQKMAKQLVRATDWTQSLVYRPARPSDALKTLEKRANRYGKFSAVSEISQGLKDMMRVTPSWYKLEPNQRESLEMIAHKIARILNGDPMYEDSWRDVAGYATRVADYLNGVDQ